MAWHHIKLRSRRWLCIKICQAICTYQAAKHSQPPKYLARYSTTTKGCKWLGTTSNSEAADGLASRYAKPSAPTRPPNIHNLQNTWPNTAWQPKVVNGLAPHQTQEPQMALHQDMPSHLHLPGRQTFTTSKIPGPIQHDNHRLQMAWHHIKLRSRRWPCIKICQAICTYRTAKHSQPPKYLAQYSMTTKGCKWLGTTSNSGAADGLASRYAKPSAPTRPPNIYNLQTTWICLSKLKQFSRNKLERTLQIIPPQIFT